jgi:hypothetical protein
MMGAALAKVASSAAQATLREGICAVSLSAWAVDQSLNLDRSIDRSKAYVNLWYSGPLMIRSIAENCTARSNFQDQGEFYWGRC